MPPAQPQQPPLAAQGNTPGVNQQYPAPPPIPPMPHMAPGAPNPMPAEPGEHPTFVRYTRHPESGQWENAEWTINQFGEGRPGVKFGDGKIFDVEADKIDHAGANTGNPPAQPAAATLGADPTAPQLNPDYDKFRQILVKLDSHSKALFDLPLDVLLTMIHRLATNQGLGGSGKMGVYGGVAQFVPDEGTFNEWAIAYLLEVQRREAAKSMPEA